MKQEYLKDIRKHYNIDKFGRIRGGVPVKGKGRQRKSVMGASSPGEVGSFA